MRTWLVASLLLLACAAALGFWLIRGAREAPVTMQHPMLMLSSPAFKNDGAIPPKYTCDGAGTSLPLAFGNVPAGARSLALIMDDPDAPGGTYDHWVVYDIPPQTSEVPEGQRVPGTAGMNSSGSTGYFGPCPPSGTHRYVLTLYALDEPLGLPEGQTKEDVLAQLNGHVLEQATLTGRYARTR